MRFLLRSWPLPVHHTLHIFEVHVKKCLLKFWVIKWFVRLCFLVMVYKHRMQIFFQITPSLAKVLLHTHEWAIPHIINEYRNGASRLLVTSKIKSQIQPDPVPTYGARIPCPVCITPNFSDKLRSLACGHLFCCQCWIMHFEVQIFQGISTGEILSINLFGYRSAWKAYLCKYFWKIVIDNHGIHYNIFIF